MTEQQYRARVRYVIGPDGSPLTIADLPPPETKRWVIRRKAEVVAAVRGGLLSLDEACERYKLTVDEFLSWQRSIDRHGLPGLQGDARAGLPQLKRFRVSQKCSVALSRCLSWHHPAQVFPPESDALTSM